MRTFKQVDKTTIKLDGVTYKGYTLGELPKNFGFTYDEEQDKDGITSWFNYKGLTYVAK